MNVPQSQTHLALAVVGASHFAECLARARTARPDMAPYVTPYTPAELESRGAMCLLTGDDRSGFAVAADGELLGLFSAEPGRGPLLVAAAVEHGAAWLGCFDGYLPTLYERAGFVEVGRVAWNPSLAPANWQGGTEPDYMSMRRGA